LPTMVLPIAFFWPAAPFHSPLLTEERPPSFSPAA
jgi:hypothetical protein